MTFRDRLKIHIEAGIPAIYVATTEWLRFKVKLDECCKSLDKKVGYWNSLEGLTVEGLTVEGSTDFEDVIKHLHEGKLEHDVTVLEYADKYLDDNASAIISLGVILRYLRDRKHQIIIISPTLKIPDIIRKEFSVLDFSLPDRDNIKYLLDEAKRDFSLEDSNVDKADAICDAVRGLGTTEIRNAFAKVAVGCKKITAEEIPLLVEEKEQIIRKSGHLEFIPTETEMDAIGGLENLKEWLTTRKIAFGIKARKSKLDAPKGVLLLGIPGTGKSLSAKAVASTWEMPLLRLDMGRIFGDHVGQSEANMRDAIKISESMEPCVLWVDEIEKGLSGGTSAGGERDGGTATRVFGTFLTWMQEKSKEVFVFATANDISRLPPELLRKGRFDEIFFVDLPGKKARQDIFKIHLKRREQEIFPTDELIETTEGFSGAEIETVVKEALFMAHKKEHGSDRVQISAQQLIEAAKSIIPLSSTMHEWIEKLRVWAGARCRKASNDLPKINLGKKLPPRLKQEISNPFISSPDESQ